MNMPAAHPQSAEIIAALRLRQRPGLYLHPVPDAKGSLTVLDRAEDADGGPVESIVGLAVGGEQGWYLGCIECRDEVEEADRRDLAYIADEPDEPLPAPDRDDY